MAKKESPSDPDVGEIPPEENVSDPAPGEIPAKEKRLWRAGAKSRLLSGLRYGQRYGRLALDHGQRYWRLGIDYAGRWVGAGLSHPRRYGRLGLRYGLRWGWPVVLWFTVLSVSLVVLVRGSMFAYQSMGWRTWRSMGWGRFGTLPDRCTRP